MIESHFLYIPMLLCPFLSRFLLEHTYLIDLLLNYCCIALGLFLNTNATHRILPSANICLFKLLIIILCYTLVDLWGKTIFIKEAIYSVWELVSYNATTKNQIKIYSPLKIHKNKKLISCSKHIFWAYKDQIFVAKVMWGHCFYNIHTWSNVIFLFSL